MKSGLLDILQQISKVIKAQNYAFYLKDEKNNRYVLKAVLSREGSRELDARPSYGGLLAYIKRTYTPAFMLPPGAAPEKITLKKVDGYKVLSVPIGGDAGIIRIGPVAKARRKTIGFVDSLARDLGHTLDMNVGFKKTG